MPEKYGKWMTVYQRFRRWSEAGAWEVVAATLAQATADKKHHRIESTTIRGHASAAGAKRRTREQAFRGSRGGFTCKVHCLSDAKGIPLAFHLTPGEAADCAAIEDTYARGDVKPRYLLADKAYETITIRDRIKDGGVCATIPSKSNRVKAIRCNKALYRERNRIERMIGISRSIAPSPLATTSSPDRSSMRYT
jgi:transposase